MDNNEKVKKIEKLKVEKNYAGNENHLNSPNTRIRGISKTTNDSAVFVYNVAKLYFRHVTLNVHFNALISLRLSRPPPTRL